MSRPPGAYHVVGPAGGSGPVEAPAVGSTTSQQQAGVPAPAAAMNAQVQRVNPGGGSGGSGSSTSPPLPEMASTTTATIHAASSHLEIPAFVVPPSNDDDVNVVVEGTPIESLPDAAVGYPAGSKEDDRRHCRCCCYHRCHGVPLIFGVLCLVTFLALGLGLGLTRTASSSGGGRDDGNTSNDGEQEECDYASNQPWLLQEEISEPKDPFYINMHVNDGSIAFVSRSFGSSLSLSRTGDRLAVGGKFGDAFHVYERRSSSSSADGIEGSIEGGGTNSSSGKDETAGGGSSSSSSRWELLGSPIPGMSTYDLGRSEDEGDRSSAIALSGNGNVIACGLPFYRTVSNVTGRYERWGSVVVYRYDDDGDGDGDGSDSGGGGASWRQLGNPILGSDARTYLGQSISISDDGTVLALGEPYYAGGTGRIRTFRYYGHGHGNDATTPSEASWEPIGVVVGENTGGEFGASVSLSRDGSTVASGSPMDGSGSVRVYRRTSDGMWLQVGDAIKAEEGGGYSSFGFPVALSGDGSRIAVSSASYGSGGDVEDGGLDKGHVRVYELTDDDATWSRMGGIVEGRDGGDGLGRSLSLSGDGATLAAGASNSDASGTDVGYARVYRYLCGNWTQVGRDIAGADVHGWTGSSVGLSETGERLAVGTPFDYEGEFSSPGYVRLYDSAFAP